MHRPLSPASTQSTISESSPEKPRSPTPEDDDESPSLSVERPQVPSLACARYSPRPCVNQGLIDALRPLRDWRFAEFGCKRFIDLCLAHTDSITFYEPAASSEGISYSTALSALIACPFKITSGKEARKINKVSLYHLSCNQDIALNNFDLADRREARNQNR